MVKTNAKATRRTGIAFARLRTNHQNTVSLLVLTSLASLVCFCAITWNFRASLQRRPSYTCFFKSKWYISRQLSSRVAREKDGNFTIPIGANYVLKMHSSLAGCQFVEWTYIMSFVVTFLLVGIFIGLKPSKKRFYRTTNGTNSRPILPPTLCLSLVFCILTAVAAIMFTVEFAEWCNSGITIGRFSIHCRMLGHIGPTIAGKSLIRRNMFSIGIIASVTAFVSMLLWMCLIFVISHRILRKLDFVESTNVIFLLEKNRPKLKVPDRHIRMLSNASAALNNVEIERDDEEDQKGSLSGNDETYKNGDYKIEENDSNNGTDTVGGRFGNETESRLNFPIGEFGRNIGYESNNQNVSNKRKSFGKERESESYFSTDGNDEDDGINEFGRIIGHESDSQNVSNKRKSFGNERENELYFSTSGNDEADGNDEFGRNIGYESGNQNVSNNKNEHAINVRDVDSLVQTGATEVNDSNDIEMNEMSKIVELSLRK